MAKDTLTVRFRLEADFETIQAIRRHFQSAPQRQRLAHLLTEQLQRLLAGPDLGAVSLAATVTSSRPRETSARPSIPPPLLSQGQLTLWDYEYNQPITHLRLGQTEWLDWLERAETRSFRYESESGCFTALKEKRRGRLVWYAHRRRGGQLRRVYLGRSENLTAAKLTEAAHQLNSSEVFDLTHQ